MNGRVTFNIFVSGSLFVAFLFLPFGKPLSHSSQPITQEASILGPGVSLERELRGGQEHAFQIALREGQYANLILDQRGIDVVIRLQEIEDNTSLTFDSEYRKEGEERLEMVAKATRNYQLRVKPSSISAAPGQYALRVIEIRSATESDRSLQEARVLDGRYR